MDFAAFRRGAGRFGAAILTLGMLATGAVAQLPDRPVRVIVPFPPGGGSDAVARIVVEGLSPLLPRGAVVENRSGANGMIGMAEVARAPADGSVLALCFMGPCALNPSLYANQPYDLLRDFAPIVMIGASQNVMTVPSGVPAATLADYVALMRQRGTMLTFASSGVGSTTHLGAELFRAWAQLPMTHVPYRGGGSVLTDHLAGRIDIFINTTIVMVPHIRTGALRALAVTGPERGVELPEVPTFAELGVPGVVMAPWFGIVAPSATPPAMVERLNAAFNDVLRTASVAAKLREGGIAVAGGSASEFGEAMRGEIARWAEVIRAHDIRPE